MKKYPISKFYYVMIVITIISAILGTLICLYFTKMAFLENLKTSDKIEIIIMPAVGIITIGLCLWEIFMDFPTGKFWLDKDSFTMRIGFKNYRMTWDQFIEYDIVGVSVESGNAAHTFWIYCSTKYLTQKEKQWFLFKTRSKLNMVHYFQYSKEPAEEMLKYIPEDAAENLKWKISHIDMNFLDKLYNK
jgi:hypothetical protein